MSEQSVRADDSAVSRADRALYAVERALTLLAGLAILAVMIVSVANILGRKLFDLPVPGFVDWMEQAVPVIAFLGIAACQRVGGHIRMDILVAQLRGRALWAFELVSALLMLGLTLIIAWGAFMHFERSFDWASPGWSRDSTIDLGLPTWPVKLLVPLMLWLLALRLGLQLWAYAQAFRRGEERPVAVPLIESAAELAAAEAETVSGAGDEAESGEEQGRAARARRR